MPDEKYQGVIQIAEKIKGDPLTKPERIELMRVLRKMKGSERKKDEVDRAISEVLGLHIAWLVEEQ